jgi:HAD superfamily hydrolase (TIGR01509 family)
MGNRDGRMAALFDLDGVIVDTEGDYSLFWKRIGQKYFPQQPTFDVDIKGSTLKEILRKYFDDDAAKVSEINRGLVALEQCMSYDYIKGVTKFLKNLREADVKMAIVTSSNASKMTQVRRMHPELLEWFDCVLTAENFRWSKPSPDCYLRAAEKLEMENSRCVVFEDSRSGLLSGRSAGMTVVGLSTTLPEEEVKALADVTIRDFRGMDVKKLTEILSR